MIERLKNVKWGYGLMAVLSALLGILSFVFNNNMLAGLAIAIGIVTILGAAVILVIAIADRERSVSFFLKCVLSAALLAAGITVLCVRESVMDIIISVFGLLLVLDGAFKAYEWVSVQTEKNVWWWINAMLAVAVIAGGYVSIRWSGAKFSIFVLGADFILDAVLNVFALVSKKSKETE